MFVCEYCGKKFDTVESLHGHYGHCKVKLKLLRDTLTPEVLEDLMFKQNMSSNYIGRVWMKEKTGHEYGAAVIIGLAKKYGFKTRNLLEANGTAERHALYVKTVKEKYGDEYTNTSQLESIKKKKEDTFLKHYGIKNIFCNNEYITECFEKKYGVKNNSLREGFTQNRCNGSRSFQHMRIENILKKLSVDFVSEPTGLFTKYCEKLHKEYSPRPDILIQDQHIIFEIQGDMWHANPKVYSKNDIIDTWDGEMTAGQIWERDGIRKEHLESFGYKVYYIWGSDIQHNIGEVICNIKNWLGLNP